MLWGKVQGAGGSVGKALKTVYSVTATNYSGTLTFPVGIQAGDFILVMQIAWISSTIFPSASYGTGFSSVNYQTGSYMVSTFNYRMANVVSYKIATGTESGASIGGFVDSNTEVAVIYVIRGRNSINAATITNISTTATTGDPPLYTINSGDNRSIVYHLASTAFNNVTPITSTTPDSTLHVSPPLCLDSGVWFSSVTGSYTFDYPDGGELIIPSGGVIVLI